MKVVCIDNKKLEKYLTIGKIYDVIYDSDDYYHLINDNNRLWFYYMEDFKLLSEVRNKKIDKLLS